MLHKLLDDLNYLFQCFLFFTFIIIIPSMVAVTAVISIMLYLTDIIGLTHTGINW